MTVRLVTLVSHYDSWVRVGLLMPTPITRPYDDMSMRITG